MTHIVREFCSSHLRDIRARFTQIYTNPWLVVLITAMLHQSEVRGTKVTSIVASSARGSCAQHLHDVRGLHDAHPTQILRVTFAWRCEPNLPQSQEPIAITTENLVIPPRERPTTTEFKWRHFRLPRRDTCYGSHWINQMMCDQFQRCQVAFTTEFTKEDGESHVNWWRNTHKGNHGASGFQQNFDMHCLFY
jgi:hypothetical protein